MSALCRDCLTLQSHEDATRCETCRSPRLVAHPELNDLAIAHLDCDAFYAAIEKRDNPDLADKPLIIGGGKRGVVSTACYIARTYGVGSAMPMFKALKACPDAIVISPNMEKYKEVAIQVKNYMKEVTPIVEPIAFDEAFLDLRGTERLHRRTAAQTMADLARKIENEVGITVSVGLSYNKFLAKVASDLEKPRGFAVLGKGDAVEFLAKQPISLIWGVGKSLQKKLARDGFHQISQLQQVDERTLIKRYGAMGHRLYALSRGLDQRRVHSHQPAKSISAETTFFEDIRDFELLKQKLWPLCERVSKRTKKAGLSGQTITLKLKTADFKIRTRSRQFDRPTQLADVIFRAAVELLTPEAGAHDYRLIGVGLSHLFPDEFADHPDLLDETGHRRAKAERAMDKVKAKFGDQAIGLGRGFRSPTRSKS